MQYTLLILGAIMFHVWILEPRLPRAFAAVTFAVVVAAGLRHAARTGEWGLSARALVPGLRASALFTLSAVALLLAYRAAAGTLRDRDDVFGTLCWLIVWGTAQQWILQTVVLREAQRATSSTSGVIMAAALFSLVHLPNVFLAAMTFIGALGWCAIYDRHPNILPLALSQAIATLVILHTFDDSVTGRLRIGYSYLTLIRGQ